MSEKPDLIRISGEVSYPVLAQHLMRDGTTVVSVAIDDDRQYEITYRSTPLSGGSASPPTLIERQIRLRGTGADTSGAKACVVVSDTYVHKHADETKARQTLIEQARWVMSLPREVADHFPGMRDEQNLDPKADHTYYTMDFVPLPTFWSLIQKGSLTESAATELLSPVLDFVYGVFLTEGAEPIHNDVEYTRIRHLSRVRKRAAEVEGTHLSPFFSGARLQLNGVTLCSPMELLEKIESNPEWMSRLEPEFLYRVHGDLHLDNILVDAVRPDRFVLIDPRGYDAGSLDYDQGKLLHSVEGMYHVWHQGRGFTLVEDEALREFQLTIDDQVLVERCRNLRDWLLETLGTRAAVRNDHDWLLRARLAEACHFLSLGRFHLHNRAGVRAMILTGIFLLNSVVCELESAESLGDFTAMVGD